MQNISLDEEDFKALIAGKIVSRDGVSVLLKDIGYDKIHDAVYQELYRAKHPLTKRPDVARAIIQENNEVVNCQQPGEAGPTGNECYIPFVQQKDTKLPSMCSHCYKKKKGEAIVRPVQMYPPKQELHTEKKIIIHHKPTKKVRKTTKPKSDEQGSKTTGV